VSDPKKPLVTPCSPPSRELIEEVCRALCRARGMNPDYDAWNGTPLWKDFWWRAVDALIAAQFLNDPTLDMRFPENGVRLDG